MKTVATSGYTVEDYLGIVFKYANRISFSKYRDFEISDDEYDALMSEAKERLERALNEFKSEAYREVVSAYVPSDEIDAYLEEMILQEKERFQEIKEMERYEGTPRADIQKKNPYWQVDFLFDTLSLETAVTISGQAFDTYTYQLSNQIKAGLQKFESLYDVIDLEEEFILEDPAFYYNDQLIGAICCHEEYSFLNLNTEQYEAEQSLISKYEKDSKKDDDFVEYILEEELLEKLMDMQINEEITDEESVSYIIKHGRLAADGETGMIMIHKDDLGK